MKTIIEHLGKVSITVEGDYNKDKDYNKLCMVLDRSTYKSYISRRPVPKGTSIDDTKYWMLFGGVVDDIVLDYKEFIERYGEQLEELDVIVKNALYFPKVDVAGNMHLYVNQLTPNDRTFKLDDNNHILFVTQ